MFISLMLVCSRANGRSEFQIEMNNTETSVNLSGSVASKVSANAGGAGDQKTVQNDEVINQHFEVLNKLIGVFMDIYRHDGYGDFRVEVKILKRRQKEVIIHAGKQYRFVLDYIPGDYSPLDALFVALPVRTLGPDDERRGYDGAERRLGINRRQLNNTRNFRLERRTGMDRRNGVPRRQLQLAHISESDIRRIVNARSGGK